MASLKQWIKSGFTTRQATLLKAVEDKPAGLPLTDARNGASVALELPASLPGVFPADITLAMSGLGSNVGNLSDLDERLAVAVTGTALEVPNDAWFLMQFNNLVVTNPNTVPALILRSDGVVNELSFTGRLIAPDQYRFDGQVLNCFPADWATGETDRVSVKIANADENIAIGGNAYLYVTTFSPA